MPRNRCIHSQHRKRVPRCLFLFKATPECSAKVQDHHSRQLFEAIMEIFQKKEAGTVFMKYVVMNSSQKWLHFMMVTLITHFILVQNMEGF